MNYITKLVNDYKKQIMIVLMLLIGIFSLTGCSESEKSTDALKSGLYPMYEKGSIKDRWGYIDEKGEYVIEPQFGYAAPFYDGLGMVYDENTEKYGYIDSFGEWIIYPQFDFATNFNEGVAIVGIGWEVGAIDTEGNYILDPIYERIHYDSTTEKFIVCDENENYKWIDWDLQVSEASEKEYDKINRNATLEYTGLIENETDTGYVRLINGKKEEISGEDVLEKLKKEHLSYEDGFDIYSFSDGLGAIVKEYSEEDDEEESYIYGFINTDFELCIEVKFFADNYDNIGYFENGIALVRTLPNEDNLVDYGYIDKKGNWLIKKQYSADLYY